MGRGEEGSEERKCSRRKDSQKTWGEGV
jgi:hypothetical protein